MGFRSNKDLKVILHPYLFVLKEGKKIQKDFLDYSLLMLQVSSLEVIPSPRHPPAKMPFHISEQDYFSLGSTQTSAPL